MPRAVAWMRSEGYAHAVKVVESVNVPDVLNAITTHAYVEGTPGDTVDLVLVWQNQGVKPLTNSDHYVETVMIGSTGKAKTSTTFQRYVKSLDAVYLRATAGAGNKADVKVTRLDSDAVAFTVA